MTTDGKIGIVTSFLGNLRAGTWVYTWNLLRHLGKQPDVVRIDREDRSLAGLEDIKELVIPGGGRLAKLTWPNLQLSSGAERAGLDLVHVTTPYGCFRQTRFKKVITICDVTPLLFPETHGRLHVWHHRLALPAILRAADRIITISEASKRDIVRCCRIAEEKISVTYLAASLPGLTPNLLVNTPDAGTGPSKPYILNVGTLEPRKNLAGLLKAFARARSKGLPHSLVVVGANGWGNSPVAQLINELGIGDHVLFTGFVDDLALPRLYAGADFFVYPSLYEGFGLPVLEAMACGAPVITSNVSSMPEVAGGAALLVDPCSTAELADAMLRLAGDEELRSQMRAKGIERAGHYNWEQTAELTWQIYQEVIGSRQ
jgi:glycosyltransferase involved in cell wall biosynthesis